jgi:hypothetical protein
LNSLRGTYTIKKGESKFEPRIDDTADPNFVDGLTNVPNQGPESSGYVPSDDITLSWATFTDAAEEAGYSRMVGGIHIAAGNDGGLDLGYMVGEAVWKRYRGLLRGTHHGKMKSHAGLRPKHKMSMQRRMQSKKHNTSEIYKKKGRQYQGKGRGKGRDDRR